LALTFGTLLSSQGSNAHRVQPLGLSRGNSPNLSGPSPRCQTVVSGTSVGAWRTSLVFRRWPADRAPAIFPLVSGAPGALMNLGDEASVRQMSGPRRGSPRLHACRAGQGGHPAQALETPTSAVSAAATAPVTVSCRSGHALRPPSRACPCGARGSGRAASRPSWDVPPRPPAWRC
jgi:hypothetical protein